MIIRYLKLYWHIIKLSINTKLIYKINFWIAFFTDLAIMGLQVFVFLTIFQFTESINGWDRNQIMFFMGTFIIINGLCMSTYFFGVISIPTLIQTGMFDIYMTKPINTRFYISLKGFDFGGLFGIIPGIFLVIYSINKGNMNVSLYKIFGYIGILLLMYILFYSLMLMFRIPAFWVVKSGAINDLEAELVDFAFKLPGIAFRGIEKLFFYVIFPYGLIATVPTQFFTDILEGKYIVLVILVSVMHFLLTSFLWKKGIKHYNSAST